jgi:ABC-type lipoprotein export system ATPase subunit
MNAPELVLCDEPTGNLDSRTSREVVDLLQELKTSLGQTFVIVTHEASLAERADRVLRIQEGLLAPVRVHELA